MEKDSEEKDSVILKGKSLSMEDIQNRIFTIRGAQVMLDRDLAIQYQVATKALNQAVKRNVRRFPERFMFQLTKEELEEWKSQIVTSNIYTKEEVDALKMSARRCPYAFTEQGVAQLSAVLHSDVAVDASVRIMDAFVAMRRFIKINAGLFQRVERLEHQQLLTNKRIDLVLDKFEEFSPSVTTEQLFQSGCVWDAYMFMCDLIRSAEKRVILVDNFVDERVLTMLDKRNKGVIAEVYTRYYEQMKLDFDKHNQQYEPISYVQLPHAVHDRYLIVDDVVWLPGTSVKDMGRSLCTIIKVGFSAEQILQMVNK
jgi:hypothetical protein